MMTALRDNTVPPQSPDVELRFSELQTQIDRLCVALQRWEQTPEYGHATEERLSQLVERCVETLDRWTIVDGRHQQMVAKLEARLSDWGFVESRLEQDSDQRIRQFEQIIEHEWETLRKAHEEPVKQLREQAASLGETCVAAANLALRGFERAETRFAALEQDLQLRMSQLTRELQIVVAELRGGAPAPTSFPAGVPPFPLESVMRIHDELRRADDRPDTAASGGTAASRPALQLTSASSGVSETATPAQTAATPQQPVPAVSRLDEKSWTRWRNAFVIALVGLVGAGVLAFALQRRAEARLNDATVRAAAAEERATGASQQVALTREDADRRITEARQAALQAQIVSGVLAAPDVIRFNLVGSSPGSRAFAQVLWSRSRGIVVSASRLPAPPSPATYQLWLLTSSGPVNAGVFVPDSAGRATLANDNLPFVPRGVSGAMVTVEPSGGRKTPTGDPILTRPQ